MVKQMLFMDAPDHTPCAVSPRRPYAARVEALRSHIREILDDLLEPLLASGRMDVIADLPHLCPRLLPPK